MTPLHPLHPLPPSIQHIINQAKDWLKDAERPGVVPSTNCKQACQDIIDWHQALMQAHLDQITPDDETLRKWVENTEKISKLVDNGSLDRLIAEEIDGPW